MNWEEIVSNTKKIADKNSRIVKRFGVEGLDLYYIALTPNKIKVTQEYGQDSRIFELEKKNNKIFINFDMEVNKRFDMSIVQEVWWDNFYEYRQEFQCKSELNLDLITIDDIREWFAFLKADSMKFDNKPKHIKMYLAKSKLNFIVFIKSFLGYPLLYGSLFWILLGTINCFIKIDKGVDFFDAFNGYSLRGGNYGFLVGLGIGIISGIYKINQIRKDV